MENELEVASIASLTFDSDSFNLKKLKVAALMGKYSSESDNEKRKSSYKSRSKRRSSSSSSSGSRTRKHRRKTDRSRSRDRYSRSRRSRSSSSVVHKAKSRRRSRSKDRSRYRDRHRRSSSRSKYRRSRSKSYIKEYSSKSRRRSSSSSSSSELKHESNIEENVKSEATPQSKILPEMSKVDVKVLNAINEDGFTSKPFTSSKSKKMMDNIVIDLKKQTIKVPEVEPVEPDSIFHHNLFLNEEARMEKWIKELYGYRQKALQQGLKSGEK